jgi:hypothetical protein
MQTEDYPHAIWIQIIIKWMGLCGETLKAAIGWYSPKVENIFIILLFTASPIVYSAGEEHFIVELGEFHLGFEEKCSSAIFGFKQDTA